MKKLLVGLIIWAFDCVIEREMKWWEVLLLPIIISIIVGSIIALKIVVKKEAIK